MPYTHRLFPQMQNRITVLVLAYNDGQTIEQALDSIAAQTGIGAIDRVVLADDASSDNTVVRANTRFPAIVTWANGTNTGQWPNLNHALRESSARAEWVVVLHADDYAEKDWIAVLAERIEACSTDVASICCSWNVVRDGKVIERGENANSPAVRIVGGATSVADTVVRGCWWKISGAAIRMRAFEDVGDFDAAFPQSGDWEWLLRALHKGWTFEYMPLSLVNYRLHPASVSSRAMQEDLEITESLAILDRYAALLTRAQRRSFLLRRCGFVAKRAARALLRGDLHRIGVAARTGLRIARSARRHLS